MYFFQSGIIPKTNNHKEPTIQFLVIKYCINNIDINEVKQKKVIWIY